MSELRTWYEKVTKDDWLQLMCCALSDFRRLNLQRVELKDLSRRERSKASRESKSIFELAKYIEVLRFIYSKVWRSSGIPELRVSVILTSVK
jgi:hypothetical protein